MCGFEVVESDNKRRIGSNAGKESVFYSLASRGSNKNVRIRCLVVVQHVEPLVCCNGESIRLAVSRWLSNFHACCDTTRMIMVLAVA